MSETGYYVITPEKGVPIKAWTKGVPLEVEARKQLLKVAQGQPGKLHQLQPRSGPRSVAP